MLKKLIKNAQIFDGKHQKLIENAAIVIEDTLVKDIVQEEVDSAQFDKVIDASGLTAIPGLTDAHVHVSITGPQDRSCPGHADAGLHNDPRCGRCDLRPEKEYR